MSVPMSRSSGSSDENCWRRALSVAVGEGDVQVWPEEFDGADILNIALSSPFGEAHFEAPLSATAEFLQSTYGIIPAGSEGDFIDVDSELDELLWQA